MRDAVFEAAFRGAFWRFMDPQIVGRKEKAQEEEARRGSRNLVQAVFFSDLSKRRDARVEEEVGQPTGKEMLQ